jgi:O-antigen/teichoic acid export membrane protein
VFVGVLNGIQRSDVLSLLTAATLVVKFAAITAALAGGKGLIGLVVADLIVAAVSVVPLVVMTKKCLPDVSLRWTRYDHTLMKRLLRFGTQLQVSRFAELVQTQFDKLLLTRFVGLSSVSMYDFGSRPLGRLRALPLTALSALVPAVSELDAERNTARIHAGLVRGTRYVIVLSVPLFLFLVFFANEVITVWLGEGFGQAASTLQLLSLAYFVSVMAGVPAFVAQGIGEPGYQMHATLLQSGLNIVLSTALVISLGYFGAVIGTAIAGIVGGTVFLHRFGKRFTPALLVTIFSVTLKPLVSIAPAIIIGMFVNHLMVDIFSVDTRLGILATLVVVGLLFLAVYIAMLVLTNVFDADDKGFIVNVVPEKFRRLLQ